MTSKGKGDVIVKLSGAAAVFVEVPDDEKWAPIARKLHGFWDPQANAWNFACEVGPKLRIALLDTFGSDGGAWKRPLRREQ